jgi:hypothetical protein
MLSCGINMLKYTLSDIVPQQHGDIAYLYNFHNNRDCPWLPFNFNNDSDG